MRRVEHPHVHRWPAWVLVAALLLLAACDPKKARPPPKPETGAAGVVAMRR